MGRNFAILKKCQKSLAKVDLVTGKILIQLWQNINYVRQIFVLGNGLILRNNRAIWSHWSPLDPYHGPCGQKK